MSWNNMPFSRPPHFSKSITVKWPSIHVSINQLGFLCVVQCLTAPPLFLKMEVPFLNFRNFYGNWGGIHAKQCVSMRKESRDIKRFVEDRRCWYAYRNTHKYFVMASARRARAQRLLDRINRWIDNGTRFSQSKYHITRWTVTGSFKKC